MRFNASQLPLSAPCFSMASMAYAEQLGVKRQLSPRKGLSKTWYARIMNCRIFDMDFDANLPRQTCWHLPWGSSSAITLQFRLLAENPFQNKPIKINGL